MRDGTYSKKTTAPSLSTASLQLAMVAGETSGDMLAALLLEGFQQRWPHLQAGGIGGPLMVHNGFSAWWPHDKLSVHGFSWELIRRYREIVAIRKQVLKRILKESPDVFIGIDAPDFNLSLEAHLRHAGIKTVHFVCPSIWAWRPERIDKLRQCASHVLCIFPFEPALLAQHGIAATYVGHPLANKIPMDIDRSAARRLLNLSDSDEVLALLPGSRRSEISYLALPFFKAAQLILQQRPLLRLVVPALPALRTQIESAARRAGIFRHIQFVNGQSHTVLAACNVTLIASGTATLEAALFKRPMVIAYKMSWLSWLLMRRKRLQAWVGLPNILCRTFVVPELLQSEATPQALAQATMAWLDACHAQKDQAELTSLESDPRPSEVLQTHLVSQKLHALEIRFRQLHEELTRDTAMLASNAVAEVLHENYSR